MGHDRTKLDVTPCHTDEHTPLHAGCLTNHIRVIYRKPQHRINAPHATHAVAFLMHKIPTRR